MPLANSVFSKLVGTFSNTFQVGKVGPKIKNNSGVIEARNAADSAYANVKAAQVQSTTALINGNILLEEDTSQLSVRNSGDSAYLKILALTPGTGDTNALTTVQYVNSNPSSAAAQIRTFSVKTPYTGAPTFTGTVFIPDNAIITRCVVETLTALQDSTPAPLTITVGTDEVGQAARFQDTTDNDTQIQGQYETTPFLPMKSTGGAGATQKFVITASGTPATGQINVFIEYVVTNAI